jgi:GH25 family lysozyme M1 (1,4-beta-N-acetylmuramidase)
MKGIDISNNQGAIDFIQVRNSGIEVVYIKATEGLTFTDPNLINNYNKAKAAKLKVGFYHFLRNNNPVSEAQHFIQSIDGLQADCLHMIDAEVQLGQTVAQISYNVRQFANYLLGQGKQVGIYTGDYFYRDNLDNTIKDLPLWVACYGGTPMATNYVGVQYSEAGRVPGISTNVDLDTFTDSILIKGDEKDLKNIVGFNNQVDKRAAEYLSDFLNCPTVDMTTTVNPVDFTKVENVYFVGGGSFPTLPNSKSIKGTDRYDTVIQVLKNIGKLK